MAILARQGRETSKQASNVHSFVFFFTHAYFDKKIIVLVDKTVRNRHIHKTAM
jgi:hypothetical protein